MQEITCYPTISMKELVDKYCHLYYIYMTINTINDKRYVGQRHTTREWDGDDYLGSGVLLKKAIKKYGKENFKKIILEYCTKENLNEREIFWIKTMNSRNLDIGYNLSIGGSGGSGKEHFNTGRPQTKEKSAKISAKKIGQHESQEHRDKISKALSGVPKSPEHIANAKAARGKYVGEQTSQFGKRGELSHFWGKKQSEETIRKRVENRAPSKDPEATKRKKKEAIQKKPILKCMYCGVESWNPGLLNRWHNENCRHKPNNLLDNSD